MSTMTIAVGTRPIYGNVTTIDEFGRAHTERAQIGEETIYRTIEVPSSATNAVDTFERTNAQYAPEQDGRSLIEEAEEAFGSGVDVGADGAYNCTEAALEAQAQIPGSTVVLLQNPDGTAHAIIRLPNDEGFYDPSAQLNGRSPFFGELPAGSQVIGELDGREIQGIMQAAADGDVSDAELAALGLSEADLRAANTAANHHSEPVPTEDEPAVSDPVQTGSGTDTRPTPTRDELDAAIEEANLCGNMAELDAVDPFRAGLPPELQEEYDRQLEALRAEVQSDENPEGRISFVYTDGATRDPAVEDLILRGMLAASFGQPGEIERALERGAAGDNGTMDIRISGLRDLNPDSPGLTNGSAARDSDIDISREGFLNSITAGRNTAIHEFTHTMQLGGEPESNFSDFGILPPYASEEEVEEFLDLYGDAYGVDARDPDADSVHFFTTVQNEFRLHPEDLQARSPELYEFMVELTGFDPLAPPIDTDDREKRHFPNHAVIAV